MFRRIMMDNERNELDFRAVSEGCPWRYHGKGFSKCRPVELQIRTTGVAAKLKDCEQKVCPMMHFKKHFARTF